MFLICLLLLNILFVNSNNSNNFKNTPTPYNSFKSYDDFRFRYNFTQNNNFKLNKSLFYESVHSYYLKK
jgi:hypothetical protein